jgi:hypothetical protein
MKTTLLALFICLSIAVPAWAQNAPLIGAVPAVFLPGADRLNGEQITSQLVTQITSFPTASSSGGFTFEIDAALGTVKPRSRGFGPTIGERARTIGGGKVNLSYSYQHVTFDSYWGHSLQDATGSDALGYPGSWDFGGRRRGIINNAVNLDISGDSSVIALVWGVANKVDVSVLAPFNHVSLGTRLTSTIAVDADNPANTGTTFVIPGEFAGTASWTGNSAGLGDVAVRAKWAPVQNAAGALAGVVELRMPSGDRNQLLGLGTTQFKAMLTAETDAGLVSPHGSIGYTFSGSDWISEGAIGSASRYGLPFSFDLANEVTISVPDEINYQAGVEATAGPVSFGVDWYGRVLRDAGKLVDQQRSAPITNAAGVQTTANYTAQRLEAGDVHLSYLSLGAKFNIARTVLLRAGTLLSLTDNGLKAKPVPTIGIEYAF